MVVNTEANQMESASNISMAFGGRNDTQADLSELHDNSFYHQQQQQHQQMIDQSIDLSNADFAIYAN